MKPSVARLALGMLAALIVISCATKKGKPAHHPAAAAHVKSKASPSPTPAPTPEVHYTATARVEGGDTSVQTPTPTPTPIPTPSPSRLPAPSPTPKSKSGNVITNTWRKIFPPKATPFPAARNDLAHATFSVSVNGVETPASAFNGTAPVPMPAPTPIQIRNRPTENFLGRMWHKVFPKKQAPPAAVPPQWIGTVKLVNEHEGYALVDGPGYVASSIGETVNSVGTNSESGVLRITADRNPPFFIADIVSGKPHAGDRVYSPKP